MSDVFLKLFNDSSTRSGNMAKCIGILKGVVSGYESIVEASSSNKELLKSLEKSKKLAEYIWENRQKELPLDYNELYLMLEKDESEATLAPVL